MHLYIKGDCGGPFAYPGLYRDFPTEEDGRWNAEFPKRDNDFEWHVFLSAQFSDEPISADLWGIASGTKDGSDEGKCGKPGTRNYFAVDWVAPP